jgi:hypothetical protein
LILAHFMAHRSGFTQKVLGGTLRSVGFQTVATNSWQGAVL